MEKVNWYGLYTLTSRETKRFMRVYNQTIINPVISSLIFLAIFILAIGPNKPNINGVHFIDFMGYGLIMMSIIQNAFANSSSSLLVSKVLGYISDILTTPLGAIEILLALTFGAIFRGVLVGVAVSISLIPFINYTIAHPLLMIFYVLASCSLLGLLGILSSILAKSFDQSQAVNSYIITPLSFLSGTFYSASSLPYFFQKINLVNPFFYMIDGFRYCITDYSDGNINIGIYLLIFTNILMFVVLTKLLHSGWRIKA